MAGSQPHLAVDDQRPGRSNDNRVEIELHELWNPFGDIGDRLEDHDEGLPVERWCAPVTVKKWSGSK